MNLSRAALILLSAFYVAKAQNCASNDNGQCDFDPFNPVVCGPDKNCGYKNFCLAAAAGYDVEADCCQAPQPSSCSFLYDPKVCGSKACPYDNLCIAELAGYSADQCTDAPEQCPAGDDAQCSGEPSNPHKCGSGKQCQYENICLARSAGYDITADCCQDTRTNTACTANVAPVSCGPPTGKQCPYDNQCLADAAGYSENQCCPAVPDDVNDVSSSLEFLSDAAGYSENQCCPAVPDGTTCTSNFAPVTCGSIPCLYVTQCEATAAGFSESDCCPQATGACTSEVDPVECGSNKCKYDGLSCANAAGFSSDQCCKLPTETSACPTNLDEVACGSLNCVYANPCIAELAGFDPNSCVRSSQNGDFNRPGVQSTGESAGAAGAFGIQKMHLIAAILSILGLLGYQMN
eukprot:CAMPEP_0178803564 /NCGR_PEP_ID=MMETSP0745-20121128/14548_1 /TAXON_ID=913974 /ORGANISM="Nitzschia punctata, Strain CCMP561" /LENGTH=404 /DNA_ID=CAMNT_0020462675 /DNA_START=92 /DNA_END=1306 /DNA_ORIENTATION=+